MIFHNITAFERLQFRPLKSLKLHFQGCPRIPPNPYSLLFGYFSKALRALFVLHEGCEQGWGCLLIQENQLRALQRVVHRFSEEDS